MKKMIPAMLFGCLFTASASVDIEPLNNPTLVHRAGNIGYFKLSVKSEITIQVLSVDIYLKYPGVCSSVSASIVSKSAGSYELGKLILSDGHGTIALEKAVLQPGIHILIIGTDVLPVAEKTGDLVQTDVTLGIGEKLIHSSTVSKVRGLTPAFSIMLDDRYPEYILTKSRGLPNQVYQRQSSLNLSEWSSNNSGQSSSTGDLLIGFKIKQPLQFFQCIPEKALFPAKSSIPTILVGPASRLVNDRLYIAEDGQIITIHQ